jgi:HPt (histidine-containing phosphotransfer) domain-containing protein
MHGDEARCLGAGIDSYITEPSRPGELASAIDRLIPLPSLPLALAPVDLEAARRLAAGDEELRAEVAAIFVESSPRYQVNLREAVQASDPVRIGQIAHTLKGASGAVGATTAQALASKLEELSQDGSDERLAALAGELARELRRAVEFLAGRSSAATA